MAKGQLQKAIERVTKKIDFYTAVREELEAQASVAKRQPPKKRLAAVPGEKAS